MACCILRVPYLLRYVCPDKDHLNPHNPNHTKLVLIKFTDRRPRKRHHPPRHKRHNLHPKLRPLTLHHKTHRHNLFRRRHHGRPSPHGRRLHNHLHASNPTLAPPYRPMGRSRRGLFQLQSTLPARHRRVPRNSIPTFHNREYHAWFRDRPLRTYYQI